MMKCLLILVAIIMLGITDIWSFPKRRVEPTIEEKVYDKIYSINEVKYFAKHIDSVYSGKRRMAVQIRSTPKGNNNYYWVQVGSNDDFRFTVYYNFYVYPPHFNVKFYDPLCHKILSIKEWQAGLKK